MSLSEHLLYPLNERATASDWLSERAKPDEHARSFTGHPDPIDFLNSPQAGRSDIPGVVGGMHLWASLCASSNQLSSPFLQAATKRHRYTN
jgi:hypothetical protein